MVLDTSANHTRKMKKIKQESKICIYKVTVLTTMISQSRRKTVIGLLAMFIYMAILLGVGIYISIRDELTYLPGTLYVSNWETYPIAGDGTRGPKDASLASEAKFCNPSGLIVDPTDNSILVVDSCSHSIRRIFSNSTVVTFVGSISGESGYLDGVGTEARFHSPFDITRDPGTGDLYVSDSHNNRIRKVTAAGVVTTLAGTGERGFNNGPGTESTFGFPTGIAFGNGFVYTCDTHHHLVRRIALNGDTISFAGIASPGSSMGIGTNAYFNSPVGLTFGGPDDALYATDTTNNLIRKIDTTTREVTDHAGNTFMAGVNYPGTPAVFNNPQGVTVASDGTVFVADTYYSLIRRVDVNGTLSTIAGSGYTKSQEGSGPNAAFYFPRGIFANTSTQVLIGDTYGYKVRGLQLS